MANSLPLPAQMVLCLKPAFAVAVQRSLPVCRSMTARYRLVE